MGKVTRGRAGREQKRDEIYTQYGAALAQMLRSQIKLDGGERVLHLGTPGATILAEDIAARLSTGELVVCVYTFDELEETRAALAGLGNVHVINDVEDLDEDEPPFDIVSCAAPYYLGRDAVLEQIQFGISRLAPDGTLLLAGDRQHEFDRYADFLSAAARDVQQVSANGQYRVVAARSRNMRKSGRIGGRLN